MPEKPKPTKKKSSATPARPVKAAAPAAPSKGGPRAKVAKAKSPQRKPGASDKPEIRELPSFAAARNAAIDELVAAIEAAELQLLSLKRATRYDELPSNGSLQLK